MRIKRTIALAATAAAALSLGAAIPAAGATPTADSGTPTYQEFATSTYRDIDGGYVVNGDELITGQGELHTFYNQILGSDGLIVNTVGGVDDRWSDAQVENLTYCVSTKFGTRHDDIVQAMQSGAALWESASSKIDFVYVSSADGSCTTRNKSALFSVGVNTVEQVSRRQFLG